MFRYCGCGLEGVIGVDMANKGTHPAFNWQT